MSLNGRTQTEDLIRNWARFDKDALILDHVYQKRMLEHAEAVADPSRPKKDRIKEIGVSVVAIAKSLTGVEEERKVDAFLGTLLAEPE